MSNYPRLDKIGLTRAINGIASKVFELIPGVFSRTENGLVPKAPSGSGTSKYLREDGTWNTPDSSMSYGTCTTAAATAAKVVTLQDASNWKLKKGTVIVVKFTNTNTAQNPTLNVNNSGAKSIYYNTVVITTGSLWTAGEANRFTSFMYDGTNWVWIGSSVDRNTTYSAMSKSELTTGTATTSRVVRADYLKQGIEEIIEDKDTNFEGTRSEWNALSAAEKAKYLTMDFTDDDGLGDISDEDVTFTSSDVVDANANSWTVVSPIASGTTLNTLFSRVSQMFKNVRYLYKTLIDEITISTTEKYIGTYNGNSLYRKLIELSYAASSGTSHTQSLSNYGITGSNVKRMYGYAEGDTNYGSFLTFPCYYNSNAYIQTYINKNTNTLYINNGPQYNNNPLKIHLIVEYTK